MLLLMGIGPVLPWRNTQEQVRRNLTLMLIALVIGTVFGLLMRWTLGVSLAVGLFVYNIVAVWLMVVQGVGERSRSLHISPIQAFAQIAATNKRRFGSHIVHVGVALSCLAIAFSMAYRSEFQKTLNIGEVWEQGGMRVALQNLLERPESNRIAVEAKLEVRSANRSAWGVDGSYTPRMNQYLAMGQPLPMPSVRYTLLNDYYFVLMQFDQENFRWATVKVIVTPMVLWLWLGGLLIVLGTLYILWPSGAAVSAKRMVPSS
jgi:cytochrome c-type biogenesis protein CcmF